MKGRVKMNSYHLQQAYADSYHDFYARYGTVASSCFSIPWGPQGGSHPSHYIRLRSKAPLKCFVGVKKCDSQIQFRDSLFFDSRERQFEQAALEDVFINLEEVKRIISGFLAEHGYAGGVEIGFLSEAQRGHSFGFYGTFAIALAVSLGILCKALDHERFRIDYDRYTESDGFKPIIDLAWKIDHVLSFFDTIGQNIYSSLKRGNHPGYLAREHMTGKERAEEISGIACKAVSLGDKYDPGNPLSRFPFDTLMVFSGVQTNVKLIAKSNEVVRQEINSYKTFFEDDVAPDLEPIMDKLYIAKYKDRNILHDIFQDSFYVLNTKTIRHFKRFYESGYDEGDMENFIRHINNKRYVCAIFERQSDFAHTLIYYFNKNRKSEAERIGIMPAYSGKLGGGYVIVLKPGISQETIFNTITEMKEKYSANLAVDFASYLDGEMADGVQIEQHIAKNIYSPFIKKDSVSYFDNRGNSEIGDYHDILRKYDGGFLLDRINGKIYLNGQKLTSKSLPSQQGTVDVLEQLIANPGKEIYNDRFPQSSYSRSKNEMSWKIIIPLLKLIESECAVKLPITCSGSLTDFYVKMEDTDFPIGLITRIGSH